MPLCHQFGEPALYRTQVRRVIQLIPNVLTITSISVTGQEGKDLFLLG